MTAHIRWLAPRLFAAILVVAGIAVLWRWRASFESCATVEALLENRPWAPAAFVAVHVIVSLTFIPRTVMALAAGLVFGLGWGILWSTVGTMAGAWAGFGLVRLLGGERLRFLHLPQLTPFLGRIESAGYRAVWMIRLLPLPHTPVNYAFGLTGISWRAYSLGTLLGILPSTVVAAAVGTAGCNALQGDAWLLPTAVGIVGLGLSVLLPRLIRPRGD